MYCCNGIALNNPSKAGNYLQGHRYWDRIGITWEAYPKWETGGFSARHEPPAQSSIVRERNKAAISNLNATTQVSDDENVHYR